MEEVNNNYNILSDWAVHDLLSCMVFAGRSKYWKQMHYVCRQHALICGQDEGGLSSNTGSHRGHNKIPEITSCCVMKELPMGWGRSVHVSVLKLTCILDGFTQPHLIKNSKTINELIQRPLKHSESHSHTECYILPYWVTPTHVVLQ